MESTLTSEIRAACGQLGALLSNRVKRTAQEKRAPRGAAGSAAGRMPGSAPRTVVKLVVASFFLACGISLFIESSLGSDTIDVLLDGLNRTFGITIGQANLAFNITLFLLGLLVNRSALGVISIAGAVLGSLFADVVNPVVVGWDLAQQSLVLRIVAAVAGQLALCSCYGIMQTIPHGSNISDALVQWVARIAPGPYALWRSVYEGACLVIGVLLGGVFGPGTVFSVLTTGVITHRIAGLVRWIDSRMATAKV